MKSWKVALAAGVAAGAPMLIAGADAQVFDSLRNRQKGQQTEQQKQEQQKQEQQSQRQQQGSRIGTLSREESAAVMPMYQAVTASDWAAARTAMPAAREGLRSPAGRFLVGQLMFRLARGTQDRPLEIEAVTQMIQSGGATPEQLVELQRLQSDYEFDAAIRSGNVAALEPLLAQRLEANPNDTTLMVQLAEVKVRLNKREEGLALFRRAIQLSQGSGQRAAEHLLRRATGVAYESRNRQLAIEFARDLLTAYPNAQNWRDSLVIYRELNNITGRAALDVYRLMRATGSLTSERDYFEYAEIAQNDAAFGEAKFALETGMQRNVVTAGNRGIAQQMLAVANQRINADRPTLASQRTEALAGAQARPVMRLADAYYGYDQFAEAVELYRAALTKQGVDANLVNLRLGAALAMAGNRAEAEAALRAVTGPRAELANFWLLWLASRTQPAAT